MNDQPATPRFCRMQGQRSTLVALIGLAARAKSASIPSPCWLHVTGHSGALCEYRRVTACPSSLVTISAGKSTSRNRATFSRCRSLCGHCSSLHSRGACPCIPIGASSLALAWRVLCVTVCVHRRPNFHVYLQPYGSTFVQDFHSESRGGTTIQFYVIGRRGSSRWRSVA